MSNSSEPYIIATDLRVDDVLLGRGDLSVRYEGNVRFRALVREKKDLYSSTSKNKKKSELARSIIGSVKARQGRFLTRLKEEEAKKLGVPSEAEAWVHADDDVVMRKVKQSFRDEDRSTNSSSGAGSEASKQEEVLPHPAAAAAMASAKQQESPVAPSLVDNAVLNARISALLAQEANKQRQQEALLRHLYLNIQQRRVDAPQMVPAFGLTPAAAAAAAAPTTAAELPNLAQLVGAQQNHHHGSMLLPPETLAALAAQAQLPQIDLRFRGLQPQNDNASSWQQVQTAESAVDRLKRMLEQGTASSTSNPNKRPRVFF